MAQQHVYEGTPHELAPYMAQRPNQRFRLTELDQEEATTVAPNKEVLAMLRDVAALKATMTPTNGEETDRLLREARAGAMYGDSTTP